MRRRFGSTLTARAVLATCLVAFVCVLVTALVAAPLALQGANREARKGLADQAQIAATLIGNRPNPLVEQRLVRQLRGQGIEVYLVRDGVLVTRGAVPARLVAALGAGQDVRNRTARVNGRLVLVEGRPLTSNPGNGILLAAGAAVRLSAGDRAVRVQPEPPAEVEELAHALNGLAAALSTSEGRQRDFLLSVSHELRTPLTTIKGYAEALSDGIIKPDEAARAGRTVLTEAEHLDRLVGDLLALARLDAVDFPVSILPVDLVELIGDATRAWRSRCPALRAELPAEPVTVPTDPGRR